MLLLLAPMAHAGSILGPEGFDTFPPAGWTQFDVAGEGFFWAADTSRPSPTSGGNAAFYDDFNPPGPNDVWLISPSMDFTGATAPQFSYWENVNFSGYADTHEVYYSTDYSGSGDPNAATWTLLSGAIGAEDTWASFSFDLTAAAGQGSVYIAFRYVGDFASEWWIDDVSVVDPDPFDVSVIAPADTDQSAGSSVDYSFRVTNTGTTADTYDLVGSGTFFDGLSTATTGMLAAGAFEDVLVTATTASSVDPAAALTLTATSQGSGSVMSSDSTMITPIPANNFGMGTGGYSFANSVALCAPSQPPYAWVDISGTGTDVTGSLDDDNFIGPFPIGFTFTFFGNDYTEFYISSNGWITFDAADPGGAPSRNNIAIPAAAVPNNLIALFWDDMNPDAPGPGGTAVIYGNGPGGELVVTFERLPEFGADPDGWITTQVLLFSNGNIRIQNAANGPSVDLVGSTVGIENADGTLGVQYHLDGAGAPLFSTPPLAIEFGTDPGGLPVELISFEIE